MATAFVAAVPGRVQDGLVIAPAVPPDLPPGLRGRRGAHPVPDDSSVAAGQAALALASEVESDETMIILVSGGASALMAAPVPGVSLADKQATTRRLLAAGADITALNTVRKHLSLLKGGRLAAACRGTTIAWLLSDVVGDDPAVIGSGPTVADPTTFTDALDVLDRYGGRKAYPPSVVNHLLLGVAGDCTETPKPDSASVARATTTVIGSAQLSVDGVSGEARNRGFTVIARPDPVIGEARLAAQRHLEWIRDCLASHSGPTCLVSSGETTVTVTGSGRGGRNQEFVLAAATGLGRFDRTVILASIGTDGIDGPTDAAGALADNDTQRRAAALGIDLDHALAQNDAWTFFEALGDLIRTGPTDTNVGDVQIVLAAADIRSS
jgi:hydroxypyruvate reductase